MGVFYLRQDRRHFSVIIKDFLAARYGGGPPFELHSRGPHGYGTCTYSACQMRMWFYRKLVLSDSPRPGTYAAMLILEPKIGAPAFATAEDPAWRLARSPDGVEDAIFQPDDGKFWSVSYTGVVESWERDADTGMYQSTPVAPMLALPAINPCPRKYLVAAPGGRLMVVLKYSEVNEGRYSQDRPCRCSFKVHVLGDGGLWEETTDIGEAALFVGVSTSGRPEIMANCVYYADDDLGKATVYKRSRGVGVYNLNHGAMTCLELGPHDGSSSWPPPAWMTPSIP
ncbi:F-box protein At2g17036 [Brachypodium distachyon]|nr:F-box protein At2g17036 [Brachypodium distachyon]|eukprot:XP_010227304.1 F-box protein At2g17036 [Brachypodium distachyon]